jgi:hypothetical protein
VQCPLLLSCCSREVDDEVCCLLIRFFGKLFIPTSLLAAYDVARGDDAGDEEDAGLMC